MSLLPPWADEMRRLFRSGSTSQFVLYGNVHDLVPLGRRPGPVPSPRRPGAVPGHVSLRRFLTEAMFEPFDVVIHYDRGRGIRIEKGAEHFQKFLEAFDAFRGTDWAKLPVEAVARGSLDLSATLPRDAARALELIDRFVRGSQALTRRDDDGRRVPAPLKVAVVLDYAHFIAPRAEALHLGGERSQILIQLLDWASDPAITGAFVATVLVSENLADLHPALVETPYSGKIQVPMPDGGELAATIDALTAGDERFDALSDFDRAGLAERLVGLSRVNVVGLVRRALANDERLSHRFVSELRKELIEKQAAGLVEFVESRRTLDDVAGHAEAKAWLRQDAELLRRGRVRALPMGYLLAGRIGTGKTFLVECLAGEVGIPVVELKNFRDKWIGATEGNLEKIFTILHALGQVIVFVDEADQATGKRGGGDGDSGLSGRIYGMLAREMSDTRNRGKILWVFATSRPDLLEVDLKRQGRLDVHIPLFPPHDRASRHALFHAMARKVGLDIDAEALPELPDDLPIGGNEMEGLLVRSLRLDALRGPDDAFPLADTIAEVIAEFRPSAHVERLELMDLVAVKECTDERFLPPRYRELDLGAVNRRIRELKAHLGEEF
ncbi:MAG: AAA family ATPase [Acidobacteriota bacterium]